MSELLGYIHFLTLACNLQKQTLLHDSKYAILINKTLGILKEVYNIIGFIKD